MGIFFDDPKPRVTKDEWKLIRGNLRFSHNFTEKQVNQVEEVFRGDLDEKRFIDKGIDIDELVKGLRWMREHMAVHNIPKEKIDVLEVEMMKKIAPYHGGTL